MDTILLYREEYTGYRIEPDSCGSSNPYYLIWQSDNKVYYQKFKMDALYKVCCFSQPAQSRYTQVFFLLRKYIGEVDSERFEPFVARFQSDGQTWYQRILNFNPTWYKLEFYWEKSYKPQQGYEHYPAHSAEVSTLDLEYRLSSGLINLNYQHNQSLRTLQLIKWIQFEVRQLEDGTDDLRLSVK